MKTLIIGPGLEDGFSYFVKVKGAVRAKGIVHSE
jgi:hypothetical protein